jgi:nucleotide-binding universal stress UspA family protein
VTGSDGGLPGIGSGHGRLEPPVMAGPDRLARGARYGGFARCLWPDVFQAGVNLYTSPVAPGEDGAFELGTDGPTSILVGVDGSTTAARAAWYAAGLGRRQRARVVAVYVEPGATMAGAAPSGAGLYLAQQQAFDEVAGDLRQRAETVSAELGVDLTFMAVHGDPFTELRRIADEIRADAVVVGAPAKAGHRLVGSLAIRLVRANRWPVTVVP